MEWILNKKVYQKATFWQSIMVYAAEQALLTVCYMLFLIVAFSRTQDWYYKALELQARTDAFAEENTEYVFGALAIVSAMVVVFVFVSMTFFRRFQLEQMEREIGVFMAQGYRKKKLSIFLFIDIFVDMIVALPFSMIVINICIRILQKQNEFYVMLSSLPMSGIQRFLWLLMSMLMISVFLVLYHGIWFLKKKKGSIVKLCRK